MHVKTKRISSTSWGFYQGKEIVLCRLTNDAGAYIEITNYGATLVSVVVDDKEGNPGNVVLGFPSFEGYLADSCYIGSTIGRFANRIGDARFTLDGIQYRLDRNDGVNCNHGGFRGFHASVFDYYVEHDQVRFTTTSKDREGGFPGNIRLSVTYSWNNRQELAIQYVAETDKLTVMNFTNHAYFNLSATSGNIFEHELVIHSKSILETREDHVPTGRIIPAGDKTFRRNAIWERINTRHGDVSGLNTYYIFDAQRNKEDSVCLLTDKHSGRTMEVFTTYPGVQLYTGDFLTSSSLNNHGSRFSPFKGLCMECQFYPDSPNHGHFPSTVVVPGQVYNEMITLRFGITE
jgi:aldose 1-epimerase